MKDKRCVHLDFHTSGEIEGIGRDFDHDEFVAALKEAGLDSITVFAKCHHGNLYYPSEKFKSSVHPRMHRALEFLGRVIKVSVVTLGKDRDRVKACLLQRGNEFVVVEVAADALDLARGVKIQMHTAFIFHKIAPFHGNAAFFLYYIDNLCKSQEKSRFCRYIRPKKGCRKRKKQAFSLTSFLWSLTLAFYTTRRLHPQAFLPQARSAKRSARRASSAARGSLRAG